MTTFRLNANIENDSCRFNEKKMLNLKNVHSLPLYLHYSIMLANILMAFKTQHLDIATLIYVLKKNIKFAYLMFIC